MGMGNTNSATGTGHALETRDGLGRANAELLLRESLTDLANAKRRISRLLATMHAVAAALEARANAEPLDRHLAKMLTEASQ